MLVTDPAGAVLALVMAGNAMADAVDLTERLDVDVDQFARPSPFVAHRRRLWLQRRQLAQTQAAKHGAHCRDGHAKLAGDLRTRLPLAPQPFDLIKALLRRPARTSQRRRAAIMKSALASAAMPAQPLVHGPS